MRCRNCGNTPSRANPGSVDEGVDRPGRVDGPVDAFLLGWRMALASDLLWREDYGIAKVAERVGSGSSGSFSVALARPVGLPPTQYRR